jgi:hypothetical protein
MTNLAKNAESPWLKPGIYLCRYKSGIGLVIHWPEHGSYYDDAASDVKKNMVNLHR